MVGETGKRCVLCQTSVVVLLLCFFAQRLTCFSLQGLGKKAEDDEIVYQTSVIDGEAGIILFNGKELNYSPSGSFVNAAGPDELVNVDLDQSDYTGSSVPASQLEDTVASEEAWRRLNASLYCGLNKMKLKVMGPGAAHLQLDMGNAPPLPLIQIPDPCGYEMRQNALGLVLVVPYDGCGIIQENGNYVLPMTWLETPVKFTCPVSPHLDEMPTLTTATPAQQHLQFPSPTRLRTLYRQKRFSPPIYEDDAYSHGFYQWLLSKNGYATSTTTTTKPCKKTTKAPTTTKTIPYPGYDLYHHYPYYYLYYYKYLASLKTTTPAPKTTSATNPPHPYYPSEIHQHIFQHFYGSVTTAKPTAKSTTTKACTQTTKKGGSKGPYDKNPFYAYLDSIRPHGRQPQIAYDSELDVRAHPSFDNWQPEWNSHELQMDHEYSDETSDY